jgi:hypothetical protein
MAMPRKIKKTVMTKAERAGIADIIKRVHEVREAATRPKEAFNADNRN